MVYQIQPNVTSGNQPEIQNHLNYLIPGWLSASIINVNQSSDLPPNVNHSSDLPPDVHHSSDLPLDVNHSSDLPPDVIHSSD